MFTWKPPDEGALLCAMMIPPVMILGSKIHSFIIFLIHKVYYKDVLQVKTLFSKVQKSGSFKNLKTTYWPHDG